MPPRQKDVTNYDDLTPPRQRTVDAFLNIINEHPDAVVLDSTDPTGISEPLRELLADAADTTVKTATRTLSENYGVLAGVAAAQNVTLPDRLDPESEVNELPMDVTPVSRSHTVHEDTNTSIDDLEFSFIENSDTTESESPSADREYPDTSQRNQESFEDLTLQRSLIVDGIVAALQYLPADDLQNSSGNTEIDWRELATEVHTLTDQPLGVVKAVVDENKDIIAERAGLNSVDDLSPFTPHIPMPDDFCLPAPLVENRAGEVSLGINWTGFDENTDLQYLIALPPSIRSLDWIDPYRELPHSDRVTAAKNGGRPPITPVVTPDDEPSGFLPPWDDEDKEADAASVTDEPNHLDDLNLESESSSSSESSTPSTSVGEQQYDDTSATTTSKKDRDEDDSVVLGVVDAPAYDSESTGYNSNLKTGVPLEETKTEYSVSNDGATDADVASAMDDAPVDTDSRNSPQEMPEGNPTPSKPELDVTVTPESNPRVDVEVDIQGSVTVNKPSPANTAVKAVTFILSILTGIAVYLRLKDSRTTHDP